MHNSQYQHPQEIRINHKEIDRMRAVLKLILGGRLDIDLDMS